MYDDPNLLHPDTESESITHEIHISIQDIDPFFNVADAAMKVVERAQIEGTIGKHDEEMLILWDALRTLVPDDTDDELDIDE